MVFFRSNFILTVLFKCHRFNRLERPGGGYRRHLAANLCDEYEAGNARRCETEVASLQLPRSIPCGHAQSFLLVGGPVAGLDLFQDYDDSVVSVVSDDCNC